MAEYKTRIYYQLKMTLASSLSIGSGENRNTDHDVIVDNSGRPFIPATAIAGVMRSGVSKENDLDKKIFGYIKTSPNEPGNEYPSQIAIYDARPDFENPKEFYITTRDSVKLRNKVGVKGAKFDMQAAEPGYRLTSYIELFDASYADEIEKLLSKINLGMLRFGTKTSRGYGQVKLQVYKKVIDNVCDWLEFDMFSDGSFSDELMLPDVADIKQIKLSLKCKGGISIREYSTDVDMPDYQTIGLVTKRINGSKTPIITGTSWAGAFRSRFEEFAGKESTDKLFGYIIPGESSSNKIISEKSKIIFNESVLGNGTYKEYTRNSIDRFSGATKDGALYTERTYYYGETELVITLLKDLDVSDKIALTSCFADLQNGFLSVGGLTSIGRGLFEITAVNGSAETAKRLNADSINLNAFVKEVFDNE